MIKIKLIKKGIFGNIYEQDLLDSRGEESIYVIRKLKALIEYLEYGFVSVSEINNLRQAYHPYYNVWFWADEWQEYSE